MGSSLSGREDTSINSISSMSSNSSVSTSASGSEERRARLACHYLPFDLLLVRACPLESVSDRESSSTGDRACFFDLGALPLGSREREPLLTGRAAALSIGRRT